MTDILYGAKGGSAASDLYTLDPTTGTESSVGATGFGITGLAFHPISGVLYGATSAASPTDASSLLTIDPVTGAGTVVGAFGFTIPDIAFDGAGVLYGWDQSGHQLATINLSTGVATPFGAVVGTTIGCGISADSGDAFYASVTVSGLYTVDQVTGVAAFLASLTGLPAPSSTATIAALAFDGADLLWGIARHTSSAWLFTTLLDGTTTTIGATGAQMDALAWSGTPTPPPPDPVGVGGVRISVAFDDPTLEETPTWTDLTATENLTAGYSIDRGRQYEFDKTDTGTATVTINDVDGILDPTNTAGPYYGLLEPLLQIKIELLNPVTDTYKTRFRGFIEDYNYSIDPSQVVTRLQIECVDLFEILTAIEMQPDGGSPPAFGDVPPPQSEGQIFFDNALAHDRIDQVLGNAGIPTGFYVLFTLNVYSAESTYAPSENVLQVVQDAADAEFPTVSNVYCDRLGRLAVHGRKAKFNPTTTAAGAAPGAWNFTHWKAGDETAVLASISDTAQIRTLSFNRGLSKVFNSCLCTPNGIDAADVQGQLSQDGTSVGQYGFRSWSAENLLISAPTDPPLTTAGAGTLTGNNALVETHQFAIFIKERYKTPRNRVTELTFRSMRPDDPRAAANWALLCGADISDLIDLTETSPGGGGFTAETWFIEGVHEEVQPLNGHYADVTLSLDLSPGDIFIGHGSGTGYELDG